jgi:4-amino-4-deoxy-L-arabinose transferase-like glycosyltransferase
VERIKKIEFRIEHYVLAACLFLGFIFTFENIGLLDFWLDEAGVYLAIRNSFWEIGKVSVAYSQSILHNYGVKIWSLIFSESALSLRSFSAFCYLILILMMYRTGAYFFQSKKTGLLAAFLMTTNYFSIWYAIETKAYTLAALIGLLSYYFFIKSVREPGRLNYFFYFIFSALAPYAHPWLALVLGSQFLSVLIFWKNFRKKTGTLFVQSLVFLTSIPFIFITLEQGRLGVNSWIGKVDIWVLPQSFTYLSFGSSWAYLFITLAVLFFLMKDVSFFRKIIGKMISRSEHSSAGASTENSAGMVSARTSKAETQMNVILMLYLLVPLILALAISQFKPAYVVGRYEMVVLPAFLLLLSNLWLKIESKIWLFFLTALLLFFSFKNILIYRENIESYRSTDRTVTEKIFSEAGNGDYLIATDLSWATAAYYSSRTKSPKKMNVVAYPREVTDHPVWTNIEKMKNEQEKYAFEADGLINEIKNNQEVKQIFVLYKTDSIINEILRKKLDENFRFIREDYPEIPREPTWFNYVLVYKK